MVHLLTMAANSTAEPLKLSDRLTVPAEVMDRRVGEETVILHLATGTYYGLDPVGARIWELIAAEHSLADVRDRMLQEYAVEAERLEQDLLKLAAELLANGLVVVAAP
ncbi:MAG: PqqD family protein [Prochlorococcaceae cyanobacterium]